MRFYTDASERTRIGSDGEIQIGTTNWPTGTMAKASGRVLIGDAGDLTLWNETNSAGGAASFKLSCKEGGDATKISYVQFFGGAENTSDQKGFLKVNVSDASGSGQEALRIDSNGYMYVAGTGGMDTDRLPNGHTINVAGTSSADGLSVIRYSANYGAYGLNIAKSNTNTLGTNTLVTDGEELGHITFYGADGTDFNAAASITALVNGTPSDGTDMPGALSFRTSPDGSATPSERLRITSGGAVGINSAVPSTAQDLTIDGASNYKAGIFYKQAGVNQYRFMCEGGTGHVYYDSFVDGGDHIFRTDASSTGGTEVLRITEEGKIGINCSSPGQLLELNGASSPCVLAKDTTNNVIAYMFADNTYANVGSASAHPVMIKQNDGNAIVIDTSKRVLLGQTVAETDMGSALQIAGSSYQASGILQARCTGDAMGPILDMVKTRNTTWHSHTIVQDGDQLGRIYFRGDDGVNYSGAGAAIIASIDGTPGANDLPGKLSFYTSDHGSDSPTERVRIKAEGNVLFNGTSTTYTETYLFKNDKSEVGMYINQTSTADDIAIICRHARGGLSGYSGKAISFRGNDSTEEGSIVIGTTATAFNTSSDYRLKENEVLISDGIARLKHLKPYRFNFKKDPGVTVDGFFAHEVTPAVPEAVSGEKDGEEMQQLDYSKVTPLLTAALQEAIAEIETLKTKVAALESA